VPGTRVSAPVEESTEQGQELCWSHPGPEDWPVVRTRFQGDTGRRGLLAFYFLHVVIWVRGGRFGHFVGRFNIIF
jgi:hypothetical protein